MSPPLTLVLLTVSMVA